MSNGRIHDTVSLVTDFGNGSDQVGVVKAVLRDLAPSVVVVDIAHDVAPFDVRGASLVLARAVPYLPEGIVIASVDPGAGTDRRLIAVEVAGGAGVFLGPDNGLLATGVALAGGAERCVVLDRDEHHLAAPGSTFAARDVLAPVAAALCNGAELETVGSPIDPSLVLPGVLPIARLEGGGLECEVLSVDRFGNCQLNVSTDDFDTAWGECPERVRVVVNGEVRNVRIVGSYAELGAATPGLVIDSSGLLSIALDRASAARELALAEGDAVRLEPGGDAPAPTTRVELRR